MIIALSSLASESDQDILHVFHVRRSRHESAGELAELLHFIACMSSLLIAAKKSLSAWTLGCMAFSFQIESVVCIWSPDTRAAVRHWT